MVRSHAYWDFSGTKERILGLHWYTVTHVRISVVRSNAYWDFSGTQYGILGFQLYAVPLLSLLPPPPPVVNLAFKTPRPQGASAFPRAAVRLGFQWHAVTYIRISAVRSKAY